ncbi:MAG: AbrB/MazE/SpoVT family DNA-binding domain-containing protein [Desulfotomaculaceae bacterium]|nr:AbrB/MazE/SpoVT family DNA-binding domain-containing protein [Desulfotomaculaceae bacterium]MDD4766628.1 AbrB/MazE/SpoVT family DNA-binding domain-containing protein [Desulfotomaculaceae bacterium]
MTKLSYLSPDGKITIPRSIMKFLNIKGGNDIIFEIQGGMLIMKKIEKADLVTSDNLIYKAV